MPVVVTCGCGKSYQAPDALQGKRVKCPTCGAIVEVPGKAPAPAARPAPATNLPAAPAAYPAAPAASVNPFEAATTPDPFGSGGAFGPVPLASSSPFGSLHGGGAYGAAQPAYGQPAYGQPAYGQANYAQPAYSQPSYAQPSYAPANYSTTVTGGGRRQVDESSWIKYVLIVGGIVAFFIVGSIALALVLPAVQAARMKAREANEMASMRNDLQRTLASEQSSSPGSGGGTSSGFGGGGSSGAKGRSGWVRYDGGCYSIEFPGKTKPASKSQATPVGVLMTKIEQFERRDGAFQTAITELPVSDSEFGQLQVVGLDKLLDDGVNNMARAAGNATISSRSSLSLNGHTARDVTFEGTISGRRIAGRARAVIINKQILEVLWLGERGKQDSDDVKSFINSLVVSEPVKSYASNNPFGGSPSGSSPGFGSPSGSPPGIGSPPGFGSPPGSPPYSGSPTGIPNPNVGGPNVGGPNFGGPNFGSPRPNPSPSFTSPPGSPTPGMGGSPGIGNSPGFGSPPGSPNIPGRTPGIGGSPGMGNTPGMRGPRGIPRPGRP